MRVRSQSPCTPRRLACARMLCNCPARRCVRCSPAPAAPRGRHRHRCRPKVAAARGEAGALADELQAGAGRTRLRRSSEAAAAAARERTLSALLADGRGTRGAARRPRSSAPRRHLAAEKQAPAARPRGARRSAWSRSTRAARPSEASVILASSNFDELATRTDYLDRIQDSDTRARRAGSSKSATRCKPGCERVAALKAPGRRLQRTARRGARRNLRRPRPGRSGGRGAALACAAARVASLADAERRGSASWVERHRGGRSGEPRRGRRRRSAAGSAGPTRSRPTS